jgi:hypothetical protein
MVDIDPTKLQAKGLWLVNNGWERSLAREARVRSGDV